MSLAKRNTAQNNSTELSIAIYHTSADSLDGDGDVAFADFKLAVDHVVREIKNEWEKLKTDRTPTA